jgi:hypothetical protein
MPRTLGLGRLAPLLVLGVVACAGTDWGRPDYGAIFDEVMFGGQPGAPQHDRVYRWSGAIRVAARGEVGSARAALVSEVMGELRRLTGHDLAAAGEGAAPNVVVYFEDGEAFLEHLRAAGARVDEFLAASLEEGFCWSTYWAQSASIVRAAVFVTGGEQGAEPYDPTRRCLYHEMGHVVGLTYHPTDAYSVLDHASATDRYTATDVMLLRLLYAPELYPGMPRADALGVVGRLVPRLAPQG